MAHFALINKENIVIAVVTVSNEKLLIDDVEVEQIGIDFLISTLSIKDNFPETEIIRQTSYNSKFRKKYAAKGDIWSESLGGFVPPKPIPLTQTETIIFNEEKWEWQTDRIIEPLKRES